jgi:hypothetical protein
MKAGKIFLAYFIFTVFASATGFSQPSSISTSKGINDSGPYITGELFAPTVPVEITTFFNRDWLSGDIYLCDGGIIRNKKFKYNGLLDELFCLDNKSNKIIKIDKEQVSRFHFKNLTGDSTVYFNKIMVKRDIISDTAEIFAEEIYTGKLSLFIFHKYSFERSELVSTERGALIKDIYKERPVYYLRYLNNNPEGFKKLNVKGLSSFIPGKEAQIKQFFRQAKRKEFKDKPELIQLCRFLNSINN